MASFSNATIPYRESITGEAVNGFPNALKPETYVEVAETLSSPGTFTSNRDTGNTASRELKVVGTFDRALANRFVNRWLDLNGLWYDAGIPLKSRSISADPSGAPVWNVSLEYAEATDEKWIDEIQITTTGGSAHIEKAKNHVGRSTLYGFPEILTYGKIGIDEEGKPEGCDIKCPNLQITVTLNWGFNAFDFNYLTTLFNLSATVNGSWFFGFPPGGLLFEGANVDRVNYADPYDNSTMYRWRVQYVFYGMPAVHDIEHVYNVETGQVTGWFEYTKAGWDYLWKTYNTVNLGGRAVNLCRQLNIDQVYNYADFYELGIPDDLFSLGEYVDVSGDTNW